KIIEGKMMTETRVCLFVLLGFLRIDLIWGGILTQKRRAEKTCGNSWELLGIGVAWACRVTGGERAGTTHQWTLMDTNHSGGWSTLPPTYDAYDMPWFYKGFSRSTYDGTYDAPTK